MRWAMAAPFGVPRLQTPASRQGSQPCRSWSLGTDAWSLTSVVGGELARADERPEDVRVRRDRGLFGRTHAARRRRTLAVLRVRRRRRRTALGRRRADEVHEADHLLLRRRSRE